MNLNDVGRDGSSPALVHDYLLVARGAERTFLAIAECWPESPVFTLLYDARAIGDRLDHRPVHTSYLQRLGIRQRGFRRLMPLFPSAAAGLAVGGYDFVVSSSSAFAHGIRTSPEAIHLCYCHSPFRYAWHARDDALREVPLPLRGVADKTLKRIRAWDLRASARVTRYIANSRLTQRRIGDFYGRDSRVVHPPVDVDRFSIGEPEDFFLVVTELVRHKRVERALVAARRAGRRLKVVGEGPELHRLRVTYADTAEFLGRLSDAELKGLYSRALALVVPNVEEFGIAAVEAQAAGRPVVAAAGGGALETVLDGQTGVLVGEGPDELAEALRSVDFLRFAPAAARRNAERFSRAEFKRRFLAEVVRARARSTLEPEEPPTPVLASAGT